MQTAATPREVIGGYADSLGKKKTETPAWRLFLLGIAAGFMIGFGAVASATATHAIQNPGLARLAAGLIFPLGLGMVMLTGSELFTGNTMIYVSVISKNASIPGLLKNWICVYLGNMAGSVLLAAGISYSGQLGLSGGAMAVYAIRTAALKCSINFGPAVVLGIFCNILVCLGVLCSLTARGATGRILGAYIPVVFFIIGGFEHCVANMYYIPAGIFAASNPGYAAMASEAGVNITALNLYNFLVTNLVPVTIGNIIGGAGIAAALWYAHVWRRE
jgi:formate/nitrite transporter